MDSAASLDHDQENVATFSKSVLYYYVLSDQNTEIFILVWYILVIYIKNNVINTWSRISST